MQGSVHQEEHPHFHTYQIHGKHLLPFSLYTTSANGREGAA